MLATMSSAVEVLTGAERDEVLAATEEEVKALEHRVTRLLAEFDMRHTVA